MTQDVYPSPSLALAEKRRASETEKAFQAFSRQVFADGALPANTKQLIAVAVARDAVSLLHSRPHEDGVAPRRDPPRAHGGDLGGGCHP